MAINTFNGDKRAFSINPRGGYDKLDFQFGKTTEVYKSCSLQWHNHYYIFGGYNERRQVSMVNGNRLQRKATLDFNFEDGACTVLNQQTIILCFDFDETKVCRKSNNPLGTFTKLPNSNHEHHSTRTASIDGKDALNQHFKLLYLRLIHRRRKKW